MISNVNAFNGGKYVQSFGIKPCDKNKAAKTDFSSDVQNTSCQNNTSRKAMPIPVYITNMLDKNSLFHNLNMIKAVEKLCMDAKNTIPYDSLDVRNYCVGDSPEEKLFNALTHPDMYYLDGKPYTGYAKEVSDDGNGIYNKYENGILRRTFMKNSETGFMGYTDDKDELARYYKETPTQKTMLESTYIGQAGKGVNKVKIVTVTKDGMKVKRYMATDDITDKEYQRLTSDVKKIFGDDLPDDSYYLFA